MIDLNQAVDLSQVLHKKDDEKAKQLPEPKGYKILCAIPRSRERVRGQ
jgi:hypothetical protein